MEHFIPVDSPSEEKSPLTVAFRAPEHLAIGSLVKYEGREYSIGEIYPDMKDGKEVLMYKLEDAEGNPLEKDGIILYVPAEALEAA